MHIELPYGHSYISLRLPDHSAVLDGGKGEAALGVEQTGASHGSAARRPEESGRSGTAHSLRDGLHTGLDSSGTEAPSVSGIAGMAGLEGKSGEPSAGTSAGKPRADNLQAIMASLENPIGSPALSKLLADRKPKSVAITISDITRAVPNKVFMPVILENIKSAGIPESNVSIIIGTGMHRPSTENEREELLGPEILDRYRVIDHRADRPETLVQVNDDPYAAVNRIFAEADFRIVTGFIEPHFMAGYSGGRKGVCPALVDLASIQRFHGYEVLSDPNAREGVLEGNPCHEIALEVAQKVGVDFLFNVTIDRDKKITGIFCGDLIAAHAAGTAQVALENGVNIEKAYDIVISTGGGFPLDQTFYQTVKGICMALPALHKRSRLLMLAACPEQLGSPEYTEIMKTYSGRWRDFLSEIASRPGRTEKDQWEFQMQCRVLKKIGEKQLLFFSDDMDPELQKQASLNPVLGEAALGDRIQRSIDELLAKRPGASVAVIPQGPYTMLFRRRA